MSATVVSSKQPAASDKPAKKRKTAFSKRKVDRAYYWMTVPAAIIFAVFLYVPFIRGRNRSPIRRCSNLQVRRITSALFSDDRVGTPIVTSSSPSSSRAINFIRCSWRCC